MRVAVIGASGNIGTALLARVARQRPQWSIIGIARRPPPVSAAPYGIEWAAHDIAAADAVTSLAGVLRGADAVVHLAWLLQPGHDLELLEQTNVDGSRNVVEAARAAGVPHLVYASSIGAYSPGSKQARIDESWPTEGVESSTYGRQKAAVERVLDAADAADSGISIARFRPGLVMQRRAGSEIARYFLGPFAPTRLLGSRRVPVLPLADEMIFQVVHAQDVAEAIIRIIDRRAAGAFNLAGEPVITPRTLAGLLGGRHRSVPASLLRAAAAAAFTARLQPSEPGWIDLALSIPIMSTERARKDLDWTPAYDAIGALDEMLQGIGAGSGTASAPMRPRDSLVERATQVLPGRLPGTKKFP
jgi:UDP-glucose 4-epimerase